jgi:uncharacterized membrane protein
MYSFAGVQRAVAVVFSVIGFSYKDKDALFNKSIFQNPEKAHLYY